MSLNFRQEMFVHEYIIDYNATQAAIRAKYSEKTAGAMGHKLLKKVEIQEAIQKARAEQIERLQIDADYVLLKLYQWVEADRGDIIDEDGSMLPIEKWPSQHRKALVDFDVSEIMDGAGVLSKVRFPDKFKALQALGNHKAIQAFKEAKTIEHTGEIRQSHSNLSEAEIDARIAELESKMGDG